LLSCVRDGDSGGDSVAVDAYAMLAEIAESDPELYLFATTIAVDQSEPGMFEFIAPLVIGTDAGRLAVRTPVFCEPDPNSTDTSFDRAMIQRWFVTLDGFRRSASRFRMQPGDLLCVDNYRILHSRDPYTGPRKLWRVWVWTTAGNGVPDTRNISLA
jgi:gamma-butyrobetaine dioxygenase